MGYESLFTPFKIGNMEVKNRIGLSPMGTNSAFTNGRKDAQEIDYFIERAKGGTGILYMGCQMLNEQIAQGSMEGYLDTYTVLPSLTSVCDGCHRYGAKIVCQISPGTGRNAFPDTFGNPPISASALPSVFNPDVICHALTKEEIAQMMEGFKFAAGVASDAGFDAIEIHAHAGYLIDQFMSPVWNKRTDEYGGSPENCARFPKEIVEAIKSVVGDSMPVIFRISLDHRFEGGRTLEDSMKLLKVLEAAGVDAFDIDAGCYETLDYIFPPSYLGESCVSYVCAEARKAVSVPLINAGAHNPDSAVELIESGNVDFVNMGRALIADPYLPIPGIDGNNVISILDAHRDPSLIKGEKIVICGGGASGLDGALEIASEMGKKVTVVEMLPECGKDVFFINKITLFTKLAENGVELMTNAKVVSIEENGLTVEKQDKTTETVLADTVISAFGMKPVLTTVDAVKAKYHLKTRVVGDSNKLGKIGEAIRDGFYAATSL